MANDVVYRRATGVVEATVDGDVVLMAPTDGRCHALRGSAGAVWGLLEADQTVDGMVARLVEQFQVAPEVCDQDVRRLLADMADAGVVVVDAGA